MIEQCLDGDVVREGGPGDAACVRIQALDSGGLVERAGECGQTFYGDIANGSKKQVGRGGRKAEMQELQRGGGWEIGDRETIDDERAQGWVDGCELWFFAFETARVGGAVGNGKRLERNQKKRLGWDDNQ